MGELLVSGRVTLGVLTVVVKGRGARFFWRRTEFVAIDVLSCLHVLLDQLFWGGQDFIVTKNSLFLW